jgi:hypothetical protein
LTAEGGIEIIDLEGNGVAIHAPAVLLDEIWVGEPVRDDLINNRIKAGISGSLKSGLGLQVF